MSALMKWFEDQRTAAEKRKAAIADVLHNARRGNNGKVCSLITENNFDIDRDCQDDYQSTPLHIVALSSNTRLAKSLIAMGASIHKRNIFGETPWDIAIKNRNTEMIKVLLEIEPKNEAFQRQIAALEAERKEMHEVIVTAHRENAQLKAGLKRKRGEPCEPCEPCKEKDNTIKRMRLEHDTTIKAKESLEKDNGDLKKTIESMRESFKK